MTPERKVRTQQIRLKLQKMREQREKLGNLSNILYAVDIVFTHVFGLLTLLWS